MIAGSDVGCAPVLCFPLGGLSGKITCTAGAKPLLIAVYSSVGCTGLNLFNQQSVNGTCQALPSPVFTANSIQAYCSKFSMLLFHRLMLHQSLINLHPRFAGLCLDAAP